MGAKDQIFIGNMIVNNRNQNTSEGCFIRFENAAFFDSSRDGVDMLGTIQNS